MDQELSVFSAEHMLSKKPPHHLPRPKNWSNHGTGTDLRRRSRLGSIRLSNQGFTALGKVNSNRGEGGDWRGEEEDDPGFFVTTKVKQPPKEDTLSWDSSCSTNSSDEDFEDNFGSHNLSSRASGRRMSRSSRTYPPIPPSARNLSSNKLDEQGRLSSNLTGGHGSTKKVENTYRLDPKPGQAFVWFKAKRPIVNIVDQLLNDFAYNAKSGPSVTRKLCEIIMKMIKRSFDWPRYRFVCNVILAQLKGQGIIIADRALWNTAYDNVASYVYRNKFIVCVVTFHALYCE
ncbi:TCTEX1 domain-containing protein 4 [Plakobranchus ocellatus]|uniref:TCTEX1 domain-containing protein 4 n=1 Tax=Plakobranchus ocellatus TaxID=259542 RepID=A0AAV4BTR7_9GAST|nr:TCTEX1 domain-containing protein 4 [Plakobranchus ocellatus]